MKACEFLFESDYADDIRSTVDDILTNLKANEIDSIPTQEVVNQLQQLGHTVSSEALVNMLDQNPLIISADETQIQVYGSAEANGEESGKSDQAVVQQLAQKAADRGIKDR